MADFPRLKTGAVEQYPAVKQVERPVRVLRFLDGGEQRFPEKGGAARRWVLRLELLDEAEMRLLEDFFVAQKGRFGTFTFTDPRDGAAYENCSLESDRMEAEFAGEGTGGTTLVIRQNWE